MDAERSLNRAGYRYLRTQSCQDKRSHHRRHLRNNALRAWTGVGRVFVFSHRND